MTYASPAKRLERERERRREVVAGKAFCCSKCKYPFEGQFHLKRHEKSCLHVPSITPETEIRPDTPQVSTESTGGQDAVTESFCHPDCSVGDWFRTWQRCLHDYAFHCAFDVHGCECTGEEDGFGGDGCWANCRGHYKVDKVRGHWRAGLGYECRFEWTNRWRITFTEEKATIAATSLLQATKFSCRIASREEIHSHIARKCVSFI